MEAVALDFTKLLDISQILDYGLSGVLLVLIIWVGRSVWNRLFADGTGYFDRYMTASVGLIDELKESTRIERENLQKLANASENQTKSVDRLTEMATRQFDATTSYGTNVSASNARLELAMEHGLKAAILAAEQLSPDDTIRGPIITELRHAYEILKHHKERAKDERD